MKQPKLNRKLAMAAAEGRAEACRVLLGQGADADARDGNGYTPLCHAILNGHSWTVSVLRECDVEFTLERGEHPTSLELAARGGHPEILVRILHEHKVAAEALDRKILADAMDASARYNRPDAMRLLMKVTASPIEAREGSELMPVHIVLKARHLECAKVLAEAENFHQGIARALTGGPVLATDGIKAWIKREEQSRERHGLLHRYFPA